MDTRHLKTDLQRFRGQSIRPDSIWPDAWTHLSKKQKEKEIVEWTDVNAKLQAARHNRRIYDVSADDKDYLKVMTETRLMLQNDNVPVIPCILRSKSRGTTSCVRNSDWIKRHGLQTQTKEGIIPSMWITFLDKGHVGIFHYDLIHKSIPILEVMKIPEAKAAVNKEGDKLKNLPAWGWYQSNPKLQCSIDWRKKENSSSRAIWADQKLANNLQKYEDRVVLWKNNVKDEYGYRAVFAGEGASAS